jgi:quinol-cytochrome oxidoreductase complex cytochrome b subunit
VYDAFWSVDTIMRDIHYGWLFRYLHAHGASFFFMCLYAHIFRTVFYATFIGKRKTWGSGIIIFMLVILTAFLGYVLP